MNEGIPSFNVIQNNCKQKVADEVSKIVMEWTVFVKSALEKPTAFSLRNMEIMFYIPSKEYSGCHEKTLKEAASVFNRELNKSGWNTPLTVSYDDEGDLRIKFQQKVTI